MQPSTAIQRPDLGIALEEFDLDASRAGFIGTKLFPPTDVMLAAANFSRVKLASLLQSADDSRAPGTDYNRGQGQFTQDYYATSEHGHEEVVDDNESKIYAYTIDSEVITAKRARDVVLRNYEKRVSAAATDTSVWTGSAYAKTVTTAWSVPASATPIDDVDAAMQNVYNNFGILPNTLCLCWNDYRNLRKCQQIIDRIKYSGRDDPKNITPQMLAAIFDLDQVLVAGGKFNSANEGQNTAALSNTWTQGLAQVCKVARTADVRETCIGRTFHWTADGSSMGGAVEEYREEKVRGNVIRVRMQTQEKVINKECGFLLQGL